jgi:hypothetical protein
LNIKIKVKKTMAKRIHFIPWVVSTELFGEVIKWNTTKKFYHIIHYSPIKNPILHFTTEGSIYIHGHGAAKSNLIETGKGTIGKDLTYFQLADRLIKTGLNKKFAGKIKIYSCESGDGDSLAFANRVAVYMRSLGYDKCEYSGYKGLIDVYARSDGHKYSDIKKKTRDKEGELHIEWIAQGRASANRVSF